MAHRLIVRRRRVNRLLPKKSYSKVFYWRIVIFVLEFFYEARFFLENMTRQ